MRSPAFEPLDEITQSYCGRAAGEQMDIIVHAANLQRGEFVRAANSAEITPDLICHIRREPAFMVFGGEDDVDVQRSE